MLPTQSSCKVTSVPSETKSWAPCAYSTVQVPGNVCFKASEPLSQVTIGMHEELGRGLRLQRMVA